MNKQNSFGVNTEPSTENSEKIKSYSSRHQKLLKSRQKKRETSQQKYQILPFKLEKATITIQRYWRHRMAIRRRVYEQLNNELETAQQITCFQNDCLEKLIQAYRVECNQLEATSQVIALRMVEEEEKEVKDCLKQCAGITFKLQNKMLSDGELRQIELEQDKHRQINRELQDQKNRLKAKLSNELHSLEETYLRQIRQQNAILLRLNKETQELQCKLKEKIIQLNKAAVNLY